MYTVDRKNKTGIPFLKCSQQLDIEEQQKGRMGFNHQIKHGTRQSCVIFSPLIRAFPKF